MPLTRIIRGRMLLLLLKAHPLIAEVPMNWVEFCIIRVNVVATNWLQKQSVEICSITMASLCAPSVSVAMGWTGLIITNHLQDCIVTVIVAICFQNT